MRIDHHCQVITKGGQKCLSSLIMTNFIFLNPNGDVEIKPSCQIHSDWVLGSLLRKEEAKKLEIKERRDDKYKIIKAISVDARNSIREIDKDLDKLAKELSAIRFDDCRSCGHNINCLGDHIGGECRIESDRQEKTLLIVASKNNTFRHAVHLHPKCARHLKARVGIDVGLKIAEKLIQTTF